MSAVDKTAALVRKDLPVGELFVNPLNPNSMSDREFNLLADNIEKMGITDPILVRPMADGKYRIVGGAHRYSVAKVMGFEEVPCTIVTDPSFDDDEEKFQIVRHNVIRGKMTPEKFMKLYESLGDKYSEEVMRDAFGFAEEKEFQKLIIQIGKDLPKELKQSFKDAAKDAKSIEDLTKILNHLFSIGGDTLPYGYMVLDVFGKESVWLRISSDTKKALVQLGGFCKQNSRTIDDILGGLIQLACTDALCNQLQDLVDQSTPVEIPDTMIELPTQDFLDSLNQG